MATAAAKDASFSSLPLAGKLFILVVLLGVVSAIYYFAFHMELAEQIDGAHAQYAQLQQQQREAEQRQQQYLQLVQELAGREALDRANKRVLPARAEIAAFLQDLNRIAELSGLQIASVQPRPEMSEQYFTKIPVKLRFVGTFHQLAKFFYNVGHLERIISMENIELTHPRAADGQVLLDVDVMATTYRQPEAAAPAPEGQ
jgi:type IV pilus assembly protein PilO